MVVAEQRAARMHQIDARISTEKPPRDQAGDDRENEIVYSVPMSL